MYTPEKNTEQDATFPSLLFVPGIEHENGDLETLMQELSDTAHIVTIEKEDIDFAHRQKEGWEHALQQALQDAAHKYDTQGLIGHSFGCFRTLRLLQAGVQAQFAVLINPPKNTPDKTKMRTGFPSLTDTQTEDRLAPLVQDLLDDEYKEFIYRHAQHEIHDGQPFRPWHKNEFRALSKDTSFPDALRSMQPTIPVDIIHSLTDPWDIPEWGDIGTNVHFSTVENGGHYLAISKPRIVAEHIRSLINDTIGSPHTPQKAVAYITTQSSLISPGHKSLS